MERGDATIPRRPADAELMSASESRQLQSSPSSLGPDFSTYVLISFSAPPVQISRQRDESGSELGALVAMAAASALSPSPRWPAYLEALRDGLDLASTRDAAALRDALAAVASARASCASRLHREICDAGSLAGAAGEEALAGGGSSRDDADDREATARTPGVKRRGSARPASPGPSRVTRARVSFGLSEEARLDDARDDDDEDAPASTSEPSAPASARTGDAPSESGSRGTPASARRSTRSASKRGSARPLGRTSSGGGFEGAPRLVGSSPALRGSGTPSASYRALGSSQLRGAYSLDDAAEWEAAKRLAEEETERTPGEASRGWDARGDVRKPRGEESAPPVADPTRAAAADQTRAASAPPPAPLDAYRLACAFRARLANGVVRGVAAAEGSRAAGGGAAFVVLAASEIEGGGAAEGAREISDAATDALLWRFSSSGDDETAPEPRLVARARLASFASDDPSARLGARHVALAPGGAAILVASRFARDPSASPARKSVFVVVVPGSHRRAVHAAGSRNRRPEPPREGAGRAGGKAIPRERPRTTTALLSDAPAPRTDSSPLVRFRRRARRDERRRRGGGRCERRRRRARLGGAAARSDVERRRTMARGGSDPSRERFRRFRRFYSRADGSNLGRRFASARVQGRGRAPRDVRRVGVFGGRRVVVRVVRRANRRGVDAGGIA
jgi:hypothetical protein